MVCSLISSFYRYLILGSNRRGRSTFGSITVFGPSRSILWETYNFVTAISSRRWVTSGSLNSVFWRRKVRSFQRCHSLTLNRPGSFSFGALKSTRKVAQFPGKTLYHLCAGLFFSVLSGECVSCRGLTVCWRSARSEPNWRFSTIFFVFFLKNITYTILLLILKIFLHYVCFFDVLARRWRGKAQTVA